MPGRWQCRMEELSDCADYTGESLLEHANLHGQAFAIVVDVRNVHRVRDLQDSQLDSFAMQPDYTFPGDVEVLDRTADVDGHLPTRRIDRSDGAFYLQQVHRFGVAVHGIASS